jgi:hypothetical protein
MSREKFEQQIDSLRKEVALLEDTCSQEHLEETALRLRGLNFTPPVVTPIETFMRMRNQDLLKEIDRLLEMPDAQACALAPDDTKKCEDLRVQYITVLIYYYKKLLELRKGNLQEWDEVDELYVHD